MTMNNETDKSYNATGTSSGIQTSSKPAISWKRELCILLIGMVCGASLFAIYVNFKMKENVLAALQGNLFLVYETDCSYEEALNLFEKNAESLPGWSINREYCQLPGDVTVFKMCHKEYAKKILNTDERRKLASIMPCSMAIYATDDGKTRLVRINPALLEEIADQENPAVFEERVLPEQEILLKQSGFKRIPR